MHRRTTRIAALAAMLALPAFGSVVIAQTLEEMTARVPVVVRGSVGQVQSSWNDEHTTIETWAEVAITESLKGGLKPGTVLMVRNPGGAVGEVRAVVSGAPAFRPGEDTLLFLERAADRPDVWLVNALSAGKVSFAKNEFGELRATRDLRGLAFYEQKGPPKYREVSKPEDLGTPDQLLARVRAAAAAKATAPVSPVKASTGVTR